MNFNNIIGRRNREQILKWFNDGKPEKKILIIQGRSGNGKTLLPLSLAQTKGYEIQVITQDNIDSNTLKTINQSISNKKIILFDDFDDFHHSKREILYDAIKISNYPIIATCTRWAFKSEIFKKTQYMRLNKPRTSEIFKHLKTISSLPPSTLHNIASRSDNVQQSLNATLTGIPPEPTHKPLSNRDKLTDLQKQRFSEPMNKDDTTIYFHDIRGYSDADIKTMIAFSKLDYLTHQRFQEIDPMIVNAIPSLPQTTFKPTIPKKKHNQKERNQRPKKVTKKKKKKPKQQGVDLYF